MDMSGYGVTDRQTYSHDVTDRPWDKDPVNRIKPSKHNEQTIAGSSGQACVHGCQNWAKREAVKT